ncbi:hypothetical protein NKH18_21210 [Streptomyces sp. M10(2022)]
MGCLRNVMADVWCRWDGRDDANAHDRRGASRMAGTVIDISGIGLFLGPDLDAEFHRPADHRPVSARSISRRPAASCASCTGSPIRRLKVALVADRVPSGVTRSPRRSPYECRRGTRSRRGSRPPAARRYPGRNGPRGRDPAVGRHRLLHLGELGRAQ